MGKTMFKSYFQILFAVSFIIALLVPLPGIILDFLLVGTIAVSILVYMRATTINEWSDMKTFPSILLMIGIFRVAINISTTRKILTDGEPGQVIEKAGEFVIGGNLLVGLVMFIILIIFQFIIANGSSRSAEVSARFTLDAMPGKQMSIDADLQQRLITEDEAQEKRKLLIMETNFYGSMDGAGKFVKGDVIFGIAVTLVNIIFGFIVGVVNKGMTMLEAAHHYTILTVGDGIVTQISSLTISIAAGLILTRVYDGSKDNLTEGIYKELMKNGIVAYAVGGILIVFGIFTPLPFLPFVILGGAAIYLGFKHQKSLSVEKAKAVEKEIAELEKNEVIEEVGDNFSVVQNNLPILVELGIDLVPLITQKLDGVTAADKVSLMRKTIAQELGVKVPAISFQDNTSLKPKGKYVIKIKGTKVAEGILKSGHLLALKTPHVYSELNAEPARDPIFDEAGYWIDETGVSEAKNEHYHILEPLGILITHLDMSIRKNLNQLIQRQQIKDLVDTLEDGHQVLLDEIKKKEVDLSLIQSVIKNLLQEGISIQDLPTIIEGIIDGKGIYKNVDDVTALVRERISRYICEKVKSYDGKIHVILLDESIEAETEVYINGHNGWHLNWDSSFESEVVKSLAQNIRKAKISDIDPVLLIRRKDFRHGMVKVLRRYDVDIPVLCADELVPDALSEIVAVVK